MRATRAYLLTPHIYILLGKIQRIYMPGKYFDKLHDWFHFFFFFFFVMVVHHTQTNLFFNISASRSFDFLFNFVFVRPKANEMWWEPNSIFMELLFYTCSYMQFTLQQSVVISPIRKCFAIFFFFYPICIQTFFHRIWLYYVY